MYDLANGSPNSEILYFSENPNGEAEVITVLLRQAGSIKKLKWDIDFSDVIIKGRASKGNVVTKYAIKRIELKEKGVSTLKPRKIWYDEIVRRLNVDGRGELLGEFKGEDLLLIVTQKGIVKTILPELSVHFDEDMIVLEKWIPNKPLSAIYYDGEKERYYIKRFLIENENREDVFISEHPKSVLELVTTDWRPVAEIEFSKVKGKETKPNQIIDVENFIAVKGIKALGNQLTSDKLKNINALAPLEYIEPEPIATSDMEVVDEEEISDETGSDLNASGEDESLPKNKKNNDDNGQPTLF
jgi:topoisomerase-4 subunit A